MPRADPAPGLIALRAVGPDDVVAACERLRMMGDRCAMAVVACDASALAAELAAVDALARLALVARRMGCVLRVRRASPELRDLVELCGLGDALGVWRNGGQPEQREQPVDVQERVDPDDPAV